mgnify:CR=1
MSVVGLVWVKGLLGVYLLDGLGELGFAVIVKLGVWVAYQSDCSAVPPDDDPLTLRSFVNDDLLVSDDGISTHPRNLSRYLALHP